jgi:hypothetical protein
LAEIKEEKMKKFLIAICLAACLVLPGFGVAAQVPDTTEPSLAVREEDAAEVQENAAEVQEDAAEVQEDATEVQEDFFVEAKDFIAAHFAGIVTALAALYAVFPKWGGIAAILRVMQSLSCVLQRFGAYVDDAKNENSIYNVLCRQGERIGAFVEELTPVLEELRAGVARLDRGADAEEKLRAVLLALEEGQELMANEFSDLISISTTVPQKHKAQLEEAFLRAKAHLHECVKEATGNDTAQKEASA